MAARAWGKIRKLKSGRYQASYIGPDGHRYNAPATNTHKGPLQEWLNARNAEVAAGTWRPPAEVEAEQAERLQTFAQYSEAWIASRTNSKGDHLRPRTLEEYKRLLRAPNPARPDDTGGPLAEFLPLIVAVISPKRVRDWRTAQLATGRKTQTSRAYGLLKAIMATAVQDGIADENPCIIRGGQSTSTGRKVLPPTEAELDTILRSITPKFKALVAVAAEGGLRYGEATALRAKDVTIERDQDTLEVVAVRVNVARAVGRTEQGIKAGATKSEAGVRKVVIFGDRARIIADHVRTLIGDALLFPAEGGSYLPQSSFHRHWNTARKAADRSDMPFHALRHFSATEYAKAGATPAENNARHGWSTPTVGLRYTHAGTRDDELAARMARRRTESA